jgi:hypothetical protein
MIQYFLTFAIRNTKRRVGKSVNTPPFHGGMTGSTPVRGTQIKGNNTVNVLFPFLFSDKTTLIKTQIFV